MVIREKYLYFWFELLSYSLFSSVDMKILVEVQSCEEGLRDHLKKGAFHLPLISYDICHLLTILYFLESTSF